MEYEFGPKKLTYRDLIDYWSARILKDLEIRKSKSLIEIRRELEDETLYYIRRAGESAFYQWKENEKEKRRSKTSINP